MSKPTLLRFARNLAFMTGLALALANALPAPTLASTETESVARRDLRKVRRATARYHDIRKAERDGYKPITACIAEPGRGAMGVHLARGDLMDDPTLDPEHPEILLYIPHGKKLRLVGVEYWRRDTDQDLTTADDRPVLLGRAFGGPMPGHIPGMPVHFDLHVWVWKTNPAGLFEAYNSTLRCPDKPSDTTH